jgi:hypothetical protein
MEGLPATAALLCFCGFDLLKALLPQGEKGFLLCLWTSIVIFAA